MSLISAHHTVTDDEYMLSISVKVSADEAGNPVYDCDGKPQYVWRVTGGSPTDSFTIKSDDLYGPSGREHDPSVMIPVLLSFLEADGESYGRHSYPDGDGLLFGEIIAEYASMLSDEIAMARIELDIE